MSDLTTITTIVNFSSSAKYESFLKKFPDSEFNHDFVIFEKDRKFGLIPGECKVFSYLSKKPVLEVSIDPLQFEVVKFNQAYFSISVINDLLKLTSLPLLKRADISKGHLPKKYRIAFHIATNINKPQNSLLFIKWDDFYLVVSPYLAIDH